ncbi:Uncharacterised protein [Zhongshania aliphaticivorans]|uniref:Uncharacterized protein n=1 Tax=Zhongshania aliphaticivorans TaxID=1470434 RepID=A0A5S9PFN3_9GAMM|nr:polysialyltransferase family glycosyltransferase [Zhongshania aliphaticivorans]CAA0102433.1 Uncharacterised protein [Zhongshania aliphaticivorans]CAA0114264.1 Uncharacterised protein [Zhongshania aliphaticivorans]
MHRYYFISSPLHFCVASSIALQHQDDLNIAVMVPGSQTFLKKYGGAAEQSSDIFGKVAYLAERTGKLNITARKSWFASYQTLFGDQQEVAIYTGNDRRPEFQSAMYWLVTQGKKPDAYYMDEGTVTYIGHKSMHSIQHRYIDPLLKKLLYGELWKNALTTGSSPWIATACVAFPDLVHPRLKEKTLLPIDVAAFSDEKFLDMARTIAALDKDQQTLLDHVSLVLTLPYEAYFIKQRHRYAELATQLKTMFSLDQMAIKPHPRISKPELLSETFPGFQVLDSSVGMELLVPLLNAECAIVGDVSSVLLTAKWLRPTMPIFALAQDEDASSKLAEIYQKLDIPIVAMEELASQLAPVKTKGANPSNG